MRCGFKNALTAFLVLCVFVPAGAQNSVAPIQAELVKRFEADKVRVGDSVLARVQLGWNGPSCELRPGGILQGRVVFQQPYSRTDKSSEIAILFEKGQCKGPAMEPLPLTVEAIVSADYARDPALQPSEEHQSLSDAVGVTMQGNTRSVSQAADTVYNEPGRTVYAGPQRPTSPKELKAGQVVGIPHLKLLVGKGPEGSSILSSTKRELRLEAGTQFVLFPNTTAGLADGLRKQAPAVSTQPAASPADPPDPPKIADEAEVCSPPACHVAFDDSPSVSEAHDAELVLPLKAFGYLPPSAERDMLGFDYHAGLAFLGPSQLLFTFDPHVLVKRTNTEATSSPALRIIRAVAFDLTSKQVVKSVEWRVADSGQYFWPLGDGQVLVHVGNELRLYGPGLEQRKKISLEGPLAFVRESPSGTVVAVGVVNERHTPEIHRQLREAEDREPEEDVVVNVFDAELRPITKIMRSSRQAFPVLSDDGEVRVVNIGVDRWRVVKYTWAGQRQVVAQARSTCPLSAQSLSGNLLFVVGCDQTDDNWYRVLRNGKVLLKGLSSSAEFEHRAGSAVNGNVFAIAIARAKQSLPWESVFRLPDLQSEHIALYSANTGQRLLELNISPVMPAVQTFAISPREEQLAVVTTDQISLYRIPARALGH